MLRLYLLLFGVELAFAENYVATSTYELTRVLQGENDLLQDLRLYVAALEHKVNTTRRFLDDALQRQQQAQLDPETFIANPLNSLPLVRRMHADAPKLWAYLKREAGADLQQIADYRLDVITDMDLTEAANGLLRIQQIYQLNERDMAQGLLTQKQYNAKLSSLDCLTLARHLRDKGEQQLAARWLQLALEQYEATPEPVYQLLQIERVDILRELSQLHVASANWSGVRALNEQILRQATSAQDQLEARAMLQGLRLHLRHLDICRGHSRPLVSSALRCRYHAPQAAPFLRLGPLKLEQLSLEPHVALYHDVIAEADRAHLVNSSKPYLRRALVGEGRPNPSRVAMNAPFDYTSSALGRRLQRRVQDMSGFELSHSGLLSVLNYGIGGMYYMHLDCWFSKDEPLYKSYLMDNRIATVLFYLTDVQLGGITSFPALNLGVRPSKGSALIWHNMNKAAECDERTLHAACPVLLGSRWVATQWITSSEQWPMNWP